MGTANYKDIAKQTLLDLNNKNGCKITPYIENMATAMSAADIVISRCGSMTLSEICAVGVAAILIPSPNVADNHQVKNAKHLENSGAAIVIEEDRLTTCSLMNEIQTLVEMPQHRINFAAKAGTLQKKNASKLIAEQILSLAK